MHHAIFSDRERDQIKEYLDNGKTPNTNFFRLLKYRAKMNELTLIEDFDLMIKFLMKIRDPIRKVDNKTEES